MTKYLKGKQKEERAQISQLSTGRCGGFGGGGVKSQNHSQQADEIGKLAPTILRQLLPRYED